MSERKPLFYTLEDDASGEPLSISKVEQGDSPADKRAVPSLSFRDSDGDFVYPQLDAQGRLPVTQDSAGITLRAFGEIDPTDGANPGLGVGGEADVVSLTLGNSKKYLEIEGSVSCFVESVFTLVLDDAGTESILGRYRVGPGQYTYNLDTDRDEVESGATGDQFLKLKAYTLTNNSNQASPLSAKLIAVEAV